MTSPVLSGAAASLALDLTKARTNGSTVRQDMVQRNRITRAQRTTAASFDEIGTTGLRHYGGFVVEEWLQRLSGKRGAWVYREMADNDPVIGAFLFAIEMLARGVQWHVEPGADERATMLVETSMDDMSGTWPDFVCEGFSMLPYGWAFCEIVYKRRQGPDAAVPSRYDDGLIGWRKLPVRAQETLQEWQFAEDGGIEAMVQVAYDGARRVIPMEKALLFRTSTKRNNPEGRSVLRNAFVPWFRKKNIEEVEAIGVERDLAGLPTLTPPEGVDLNAPGNEQIKQAAEDLVTAVRRDEDEGIVFPSAGWKFELVTTGGRRQLDTDAIIRRYDQRIATTVLADFILLAQDKVGSYALGSVKIDTFGQAMQAWLWSIAEVLNRYAIPRLLRLNGMSVVDPPKIVPGSVGQQDLEVLGAFLESLEKAGAPVDWSDDLMGFLFGLAGLPKPEDGAGQAAPQPTEKRDRVGKADSAPVPPRVQASREELQQAHEDAVQQLQEAFAEVRALQVEDIAKQIRDATGTAALVGIVPAVAGTAKLATALQRVFEHGAETAQREAEAQGATLPDVSSDAAQEYAQQAAETVAAVLANQLGQSAASQAVRQAGAGADMQQVADNVTEYLNGLSGANAAYELSGAVTRAQNEGRMAAMEGSPDGTTFEASDLEDASTCAPCRANDGTQYESLMEARRDFPAGQYLGCLGMARCRCAVVAVYPETVGQA